MQTLFLNQLSEKPHPCTAAVGFFDGLHRGHSYLIEELKKEAARRKQCSMIVTFLEHPQKILRPEDPVAILTTFPEKLNLLQESGVDYCVVLEFTKEMAMLSARSFLQDILARKLSVATLLVGHDHRFGCNREDGLDAYVIYGKEVGMELLGADCCCVSQEVETKSSSIRRLLQQGQLLEAQNLLGRPYSMMGEVIHGQKLGRRIGFPTANLQLDSADKLIPAPGVYAVRAYLKNQIRWGMMNIGYRPTVDSGQSLSLEVNLFDFDQDIYGQYMRVELLQRVRSERKFDSLDALVAQLHKDRELIVAEIQMKHPFDCL